MADASAALAKGNAMALAGGTDVLDTLKDRILPDAMYPAVIVNLKTITPSLDYIKEEGGMLKIGALTRLADIAESTTVQTKYTALAQAAGSGSLTSHPGDGHHRRQHLPARPLLVLPQRGQPLLTASARAAPLLCHGRRQPLPLHLRHG